MFNSIFFIFNNIYSPVRTSLRDKKGTLSNIKRPRENQNIQPALSSKTSLFFESCSPSIHVVFRRILSFLLNKLMRITHERSRHDKRMRGHAKPINNLLDFCLLVSVSVLHSDFTLLNFFQFTDYFKTPGPLSLENLHLLQIKFQNKRRNKRKS